jgi:hypothetical protein
MRCRLIACLLLPALALSACGGGNKKVDTASYTCAQFNKSLRTKGDDTAGTYINELRKDADLGQDTKVERREISLGLFFACRGKPGSTKPAAAAIATAQKIKAGKFKTPGPTKKSNN